MAKTTDQVLSDLSTAGSTAVIQVATTGVNFHDVRGQLDVFESGWKNLQVDGASPLDNMSGARRLVIVIDRAVSNQNVIPMKVVQRQ